MKIRLLILFVSIHPLVFAQSLNSIVDNYFFDTRSYNIINLNKQQQRFSSDLVKVKRTFETEGIEAVLFSGFDYKINDIEKGYAINMMSKQDDASKPTHFSMDWKGAAYLHKSDPLITDLQRRGEDPLKNVVNLIGSLYLQNEGNYLYLYEKPENPSKSNLVQINEGDTRYLAVGKRYLIKNCIDSLFSLYDWVCNTYHVRLHQLNSHLYMIVLALNNNQVTGDTVAFGKNSNNAFNHGYFEATLIMLKNETGEILIYRRGLAAANDKYSQNEKPAAFFVSHQEEIYDVARDRYNGILKKLNDLKPPLSVVKQVASKVDRVHLSLVFPQLRDRL